MPNQCTRPGEPQLWGETYKANFYLPESGGISTLTRQLTSEASERGMHIDQIFSGSGVLASFS